MIRAQVDDWHGARRFRLDDPPRRNSLDLATVQALRDELRGTPDAPFVLGSAADGVFCAGADLKADRSERARTSDTLYEVYELIITRPGPVLAVVDGLAVGGGAQLLAAADVRVIGARARMRWVGAGHGLVVGAWILPALVGRSVATELALTSRWTAADGLVARGLAGEIAKDPGEQAAGLLGHLATLDARAVADFKSMTAVPDLVDRLRHERQRNADWDGKAAFPPRGLAEPQ
ncbi:enoyl-CoA hydratase/isomerase family protein [Cumulibacter manganitolerans]|uniref:enoyl-CoA hydratase/isomerase family protein n=1 Tax=Cumulibacter manganitolerans TaxID=1884992 RepID=UPI001297478B|nr:enoyl-CoA hydratase/isomerase family protein [Cumulibacter manganitolerans]